MLGIDGDLTMCKEKYLMESGMHCKSHNKIDEILDEYMGFMVFYLTKNLSKEVIMYVVFLCSPFL